MLYLLSCQDIRRILLILEESVLCKLVMIKKLKTKKQATGSVQYDVNLHNLYRYPILLLK